MEEGKRMGFGTMAVHGGGTLDPVTRASVTPIYQTASFVFRDCSHAARLFSAEEQGDIYTRISNPTCAAFESHVALLEGGKGAVATASGQAAVAYSVLALAGQGDHVVATSNLYGGTYALFTGTLRRLGIGVTFVPPNDFGALDKALTPRTKAIYGETMGNPALDVLDIEGTARIAHDHGVPLVVDNTFATPYLCRPLEHGADIVLHSATKYIAGNGTSIGGVIVDSGRFDWANGRFDRFTEPTLPGARSYVEVHGDLAFAAMVRGQMVRDMGACLAPFNAFLFILGLQDLHVRMERHCWNAMTVARHLRSHPAVKWVRYPGLETDPSHRLACKYLRGGYGAMVSFGVMGGLEAGKRFADSVRLILLLANLGDARSLVVHPASTTHQQLTPEQREAAGVPDDLIRLSVGLEDVQDIIEDIDRALASAVGT
ncbi:MAG: O-acetylhomoserine aminocarboxypropyltransferase/cysteine synthase [Firmicutes bacterium]|jgi:O-acetylhomoserine (thiol)-lyase|nr:O-acetylhomoserine aminocarboxypropyltransferase/cysteine synthase [Bacillota bacterium]